MFKLLLRFLAKKEVLFLLCIVLMVGGFLCWDNRESRILKEEVRDLRLQLAASEQKVDTFLLHDSVFVWKERVVEVDRTDYKKQLADRQLIKDLELRVSQVESENRMLLATRDTVYLRPDGEPSGTVAYRDKWVDFSFDMNDSSLVYAVRDSLVTLVAREYKHKFLWWRWGTKGYQVYIVNFNPHSRVYYNKYIRVMK